MNFEVVNEKNKVVMQTSHYECIPCKEQVVEMIKIGYKIKLDGKSVSKNKINDIYKESKQEG